MMAPMILRPRDRTLATPYFPVGGPVPAADLVGREAYLRRLIERLEDGQHVLISGPRRIGKTSIIVETLRRMRRHGAYTAYVDCLGATDIRGLGERLADAILQNLSGVERSFEQAKAIAAGMHPTVKVKYEHVELALQLARETNAQRFFEGALDLSQGLAKRSGKRVVVVLDEFQAAGRLGPRVFDVMRARFQAHRGVSYAFLGSEQGILEELFSAKGHAFYRFAVPLDLTDAGGHRFGIDPDDWLEYLKTKFAAKKMTIDDASIDRLLDATGGHPQDTMQVCAALYYLMRDATARTVSSDFLEVAYEQAMRELERPFALHWTELGSHKYLQQVAKRIAHKAVLYAADAEGGTVPRPEVLRALAALQERGLAVRLGRGRYDFVEPMFGEYVRRLDEGLVGAARVPTR
jgi:AAA+ ATPase superfamily predicted ATPase